MEFLYNNKKLKLQVATSDETYEENLKRNGIETKKIDNDTLIASSPGTRVTCTSFSYESPNTHSAVYTYEYVEVWDGNAEFGCYVVGSDEPLDDVFALYDAVMTALK